MNDPEITQRVIAILTQAREVTDLYDEDVERGNAARKPS